MSRDRGAPPAVPPSVAAMIAQAAFEQARQQGEGPVVRMLEARIYAPTSGPKDAPLAVLKEDQIAGHDPEAMAVIELLDAETGRQKIWRGFPYTLEIQPVQQSDLTIPPGARGPGRIVGG